MKHKQKFSKLLYSVKNTEEFDDIYNEFVKPFKEFDCKNNTEIFETVNMFVEMDGNYKKTAQVLFQHENTIRYRIAKAKKILDMEDSNLQFLGCISLLSKINNIYEDKKMSV